MKCINTSTTNFAIPLFNVHMPESVIGPLKETLASGYIGQGKRVDEFEGIIGKWLGNPYVVSVNACTSAIMLALRIAGVGHGDDVLTTSLTCFATNAPILALGAKPIWVDIDPETGNIDATKIEGKITSKTKAILVVDLGGYPCDYDIIMKIAKEYRIKVVEDAAHSFGALYKRKKVGNQADFVCFSFQAIKHITTGDGGALVCKNEEDYKRAKILRWYGIDRSKNGKDLRHISDIEEYGYKFHMNDLSATIGIEQMKYIDNILATCKANANTYSWLLKEAVLNEDLQLLQYNNDERITGSKSAYWLYIILVKNKKKFIDYMLDRGIQVSSVHKLNHTYAVMKKYYIELPETDKFYNKMVCLPVGSWLKKKDIEKVVEAIYER